MKFTAYILFLFFSITSKIAFSEDFSGFSPSTDYQFDNGSEIVVRSLNKNQIDNLVVLGKVWGFLKYHHPTVVRGGKQWDYELLRIIPKVLAAPNRESADAVLLAWIAGLGPDAHCQQCAKLDSSELELSPELTWLQDTSLSLPLQKELKEIYENRSLSKEQFYVSLTPVIGNPQFTRELYYKDIVFPDFGFQLLSLFRFWNIIEYWAPYRDQIGEDWDGVLHQSIAKVALAKDRASYELEMLKVIIRIHDTHANLWSSLEVRPPFGQCSLPVVVRFVEGQAIVTNYGNAKPDTENGLRIGDIIEEVDGRPVDTLVEQWKPYYAASNEAAQMRDIARWLGVGVCGPTHLRVGRESGQHEFEVVRVPLSELNMPYTHDREGDTFQFLSDNIAYIKLSSVKRADIPNYIERAAKTKGLIIDIRNYPLEFVPLSLGQYLVDKPTDFVRFTVGDINNPGAFHWKQSLKITPHQSPYGGKIMVLVDETSQSRAEYTAMALRVGSRAKVIGSATAGADGDGSAIRLPGGLRTLISGIGIFYPDKRPTQRIGIVPDIKVLPSVMGIRAGRDEVIDAAIAEINKN